jgi:hypothetical protein
MRPRPRLLVVGERVHNQIQVGALHLRLRITTRGWDRAGEVEGTNDLYDVRVFFVCEREIDIKKKIGCSKFSFYFVIVHHSELLLQHNTNARLRANAECLKKIAKYKHHSTCTDGLGSTLANAPKKNYPEVVQVIAADSCSDLDKCNRTHHFFPA